MHLVFYDGECGLCDRFVEFLLKNDRKKHFVFAPLQGTTADQYLKSLPPEARFTDSLILIENYSSAHPRVFMLAKGALRTGWLLGWPWTLLGLLSFLPGWMFNWAYRLVASYRHLFFPQGQCRLPTKEDKTRFLP